MMTTAKLLLHCPDKPGILAEVTDFITVNKGNIIYLDQYVDHVENYLKLTEEEIIDTLAHNQPKLNLTDKQKERWHKKCLILVEFSNVEKIEPAYDFDHQGNMDDWLIIDKIEDVVVGTSIPYNYEKSKFK
jgi:hypothetical protein